MKIKSFTIVIAIFFMIHFNQSVFPEEYLNGNIEKADFLNVGVGYSSYYSSVGFSHQRCFKRNLFSIQFIYNFELDIFDSQSPSNSILDIAILYGRVFKSGKGFISFSTGLGYMYNVYRGEFLRSEGGWFAGTSYYEKKTRNSMGIPIDMQFILTPSSSFGFGIKGFANINSKKSYFGILFCFIRIINH